MPKLVFVTGISISTSTYIYSFVKNLLLKSDDLIDVGELKDQNLLNIFKKYENTNKTILIHTLDYNSIYSIMSKTYEIIVIAVNRDIRDVISQTMKSNDLEFEQVFSKYKLSSMFRNYNSWLDFERVIQIRYEELISNYNSTIQQVAGIFVQNTNLELIEKPSIELEKSHLTKLQTGIIQYYSREWLLAYNYKINPLIYNHPLIWKGFKFWRHLLKGTLLKRLTDSYHSQVKKKEELSKTSDDYIKHVLETGAKINLYKDSQLSQMIMGGNFEKQEISFLQRFTKKGDTFIDVGSNIGLFSLIASPIVGKTGKVIALEPSKTTYSRLIENININSFSNINPLQIGLSDFVEQKELFVELGGYDAWNSFGKPSEGNFIDTEVVTTNTLDNLIKELDLNNIQLIKIDVEGWEIPVLQGGEKLLSLDNAPVLMVEFTEQNAKNAGFSCRQVYKLGESYGYSWYNYDFESNKLSHAKLKDSYPYENLFAIKDIEKAIKTLGT